MKYKTTYFRLSIDEHVKMNEFEMGSLIENGSPYLGEVRELVDSFKLDVEKEVGSEELLRWFASFPNKSPETISRIMDLVRNEKMLDRFENYFPNRLQYRDFYPLMLIDIKKTEEELRSPNRRSKLSEEKIKDSLLYHEENNAHIVEVMDYYGFDADDLGVLNVLMRIYSDRKLNQGLQRLLHIYSVLINKKEYRFTLEDEIELNKHMEHVASEGWRLHSMKEINRAVSNVGGFYNGGYGYGYTIQEGFVMVWEKE